MIKTFAILVLLFCSNQITAQKCLQLEKYGSFKTVRYYIGDEIKFQLRNDESGWHTRMITNLDVPGNRLIFGNHPVHIDSIRMIQLDRTAGMQIVGAALMIGGVNSIIFSSAYPAIQGYPVNWQGVAYGAVGIIVGQMIRMLFKTKKFKISDRKRLRMLDLNFGPPMPAPPGRS